MGAQIPQERDDTMSRRNERAREEIIVSLGVALAVTPKFERQYYARVSTSRRTAEHADKRETVALNAMAPQLAQRFAPFAVFSGEDVHHWQIVEPTVRQALIDVPIAQRVLLAKSSADIHGEIAKLIFEAVDRKYRLIALPAIPAGNRGGWWELAFEQEYGKPKSSDTLLA